MQKLAALLNLSDDAIGIAEGWSLLPDDAQRHVQLLINDYVTQLIPTLAEPYQNARRSDQLRMNRIIERIQTMYRNSDE